MPEFTPPFRGTFTETQTKALLGPINPRRVYTANGQSHVPYFETLAHLIRIFGFGNHAIEVIETELIFETVLETSKEGTFEYGPRNDRKTANKADNPHTWRYDVCYRATVRLTVFDENHAVVTTFENVSTGDASNQTRADGHDLALKSAVSLATKRCAINLGDQFGLSLYNKGQRTGLIGGTHIIPKGLATDESVWKPASSQAADAHVEQVQTEGIDETEKASSFGPGGDGGQDESHPATDAEAEARLEHSLGARPVSEESTVNPGEHPTEDDGTGPSNPGSQS